MTQPYLCAFPASGELGLIESLGFKGVRFDVRNLEQVSAIENLKAHPHLSPLVILDNYDLVIPTAEAIMRLGRGAIELVNEPNLNGWNARDWAQFTKAAYPAIKAEGPIPVVSGGVSNLNHDQLHYLGEGLAAGLQCDIIGFHRYRTEDPPSVALKDYSSRQEEFAALRHVIGSKDAWCTEIGWHTAPQPHGVRMTDEQVALFAVQEFQYQQAAGVAVMAWFQITDGPSENFEDHFGILYLDKTEKPVARVWKDLGR